MPELPSGTVTFLFTDIEGSTRLLEEHGEGYAELLAEHRGVLRTAVERHGGVEVDRQGDAFFIVFSSAAGAVAAAADAQNALSVPVRMGIHTGEPALAGEGYVGMDVHLAARICSAAHGRQLVLSEATRVLVDGTGLRPLGEHRLKDFDEAIALYQLGDAEFPPLRTVSNTNLPHPASSFLGRAREIEEISALIGAGTRLVTLTGSGGSGKTRLAIEVAGGLLTEFPAGVFWVGLASLRDPALVLESVAQVVGAHGDLASHIGDRKLLLLLDNLEQVVAAAPELSALLSACSNLRLLVTSRELLRIQGEVEYAVPPLSDHEAVELFCERSRLGPSEEIAELCRRLDDLPLAVELAAARTSVLSPAQILERLSQRLDLLKGGRDAEMRQRTLRATIEWSYDLLSPEEQRLLAQLGVFTGGWSLETAEAVCGADLDTMQSLVDKNLIRHTGERFWMLETIREYSVDRLEESGEAVKSRAAHAEYYLEVVEDLEPRLRGGEAQEVAFQRLEAELGNLRAALQFGLDGHPDLLVGLVAGSGFFLIVRGHEHEGRRWSALASRTRAGTATARGKVLRIAGRTAFNVRDLDQARAFFGEALECSRQSGDDQSYVESLRGLGDVTTVEGDTEGARSFYEEARTVSEAAGHDWSVANILSSLANLAMTESRWEEGYMLSTEASERLRASGDWAGATSILVDVGLSALRLGRRSEARAALSAVVVSDVADPEAVSYAFDSLAWLLAEGGHAAVSAQVLGAADELFKDVGTTRGGPEQALRDDALLRLRGLMSPGELEEAITRGRHLSPEVAARLALTALD